MHCVISKGDAFAEDVTFSRVSMLSYYPDSGMGELEKPQIVLVLRRW